MSAAPVVRDTLAARLSLAASGAAVAVVLGAVLVGWRAVGGGPPTPLILGALAAVVLLGLVGGLLAPVRAVSAGTLRAAARLGAVAMAAALGLATGLLVLGRIPDPDERALLGPVLVAVAVGAVAAGPLAGRAEAAARGLAPAPARLPDGLLHTFADHAAAGVPVPDLLRELGETVRRDWRLSRVEFWTGGGDRLTRTSSVPDAPPRDELDVEALRVLRRVAVAGEGWLRLWLPGFLAGRDERQLRVAPAVHGENVLALIVVERPSGTDRLGLREERALIELARRLAIVLRNRDLDDQLQDTLLDLRRRNAELRASRRRLVEVADAERRRIERDLHDGAQQHLVSLAVGLGLLRDSVPARSAPAGWEADLDQLDLQVRQALEDLRHLAQGIYPSLLRDAGLAQALPAAARRSSARVRVEVGSAERYRPEVEAAVYFCCLEALQNAAKHAPGAEVGVRLWREGDRLLFSVRDGGAGFDPAAAPSGQGLQNMADRLGAVGGDVSVRSAPGAGTTVAGFVPVGRDG